MSILLRHLWNLYTVYDEQLPRIARYKTTPSMCRGDRREGIERKDKKFIVVGFD
jgi:hypothetical protein